MICRKYDPHKSSLSEVTDFEKCADLNGSQGFLLKTLWQ